MESKVVIIIAIIEVVASAIKVGAVAIDTFEVKITFAKVDQVEEGSAREDLVVGDLETQASMIGGLVEEDQVIGDLAMAKEAD